MKPRTIAIDGLAASGKTTLGNLLAQRYNYLFLDTGVMYRAATWYALQQQADLTDEAAVAALTKQMPLEILSPTVEDGRHATILFGQKDITWLIRGSEVDANVSCVASYPQVRHILVDCQREIAQQGAVVMVGRDIGTVVLPNADLKLFTVASATERAERRHKENQRLELATDYQTILESMTQRDKMDRERMVSPMLPAEDAIIIDTDGLTQEEVVEKVKPLILGA